MQGKALAKGAAGDRVLVANLTSGTRVEGIIATDGSVIIQ
jgi:flagella basal body P-ring formation protein FlgA